MRCPTCRSVERPSGDIRIASCNSERRGTVSPYEVKLFGIELLLHRWGLSEFVFDDERQVFCNQDGSVVLSRRHADRDSLFGEFRE